MATYVDQLSADPERLGRAITRLAEEQRATVRRLEQLYEEYVAQLDQSVLRLLLLRELFGPGHGETQEAERRTEDASKPVTELRGLLHRQREILSLFQARREEFERTGGLQSLSASGQEMPAVGAEATA